MSETRTAGSRTATGSCDKASYSFQDQRDGGWSPTVPLQIIAFLGEVFGGLEDIALLFRKAFE